MRASCTVLIVSLLLHTGAYAGTQPDEARGTSATTKPKTGSESDSSIATEQVHSEEEGEHSSRETEEAKTPPPVELTGQFMLRYTQRLDSETPNGAELYNLRLYLDREYRNWRFFAEPRVRQTPLRSFSPSNIWIQQAWVGYEHPQGLIDAHVGLIYRRFGLFWDNSWFGNLPYLNAQKLNPDYGAEARGSIPVTDNLGIEYVGQVMASEDGLNGFFAPESKLTALQAAVDQPYTLDFDSSPNHTERHILIGGLHPSFSMGEFTATVGGSVMTSQLESGVVERTGRRRMLGADITISYGGASLYGEYIRLTQTGFGRETGQKMALAGAEYQWTRDARFLQEVSGRVNVSGVRYDFGRTEERLATAGTHVRINELVGATIEYVWWDFDDERIVHRIEWILHAYF